MQRRSFLKATMAGAGAVALGPDFWRRAYAAPATAGPGPYGPLLSPDVNGIQLPAGFSSRVVARSGQPLGTPPYPWHVFPDGGATFPTGDGGWAYVSNSESPAFAGGGCSAVRFASDGTITSAYRILSGTSQNCAGGPTPWGTWLSCEEYDGGRVWECDPLAPGQGVVRPLLGTFSHEAAAVDPVGKRLYLTEDQPDGRFYRFTPAAYPDLSAGTLEAASVGVGDLLSWVPVDPLVPARLNRPAGTTVFRGGEGCWYDSGFVYFTTKGDNRVWSFETATSRLEVIYDDDNFAAGHAPLTGVDNVTVSRSGDILVAEDGGNLEIVLITPEPNRVAAPLIRIQGQDGSEVTGPAFDPSGSRLYFSSQRGGGPGAGPGITYEVSGPFRSAAPVPVIPESGLTPLLPASALAALGAAYVLKLRRRQDETGAG